MKFCRTLARAPFALAFLLLSSCQQPTLIEPEIVRENRDVTLTIRLEPGADTPTVRAALDRFSREWSASTGATVVVDANAAAPSIRVFPAAELHALAGSLRTVPPELRSAQHPWYRYSDLIPWATSRILVSDGAVKALPLVGEGQVLIGRTDLMARYLPQWQALHPGATLELPSTWEEFAEQAAFYAARTGLPALAPMSPDDIERLFYSIAVDYDRFLLTESARGSRLPKREEEDLLFGWQYNPSNSKPRLDAPAFAHALSLMKKLDLYRPNPGADFALAVVTMPQLAQILAVSGNRSRTAVGPLPGAGFVFDPARPGERLSVPGSQPNRVPYLGWGTVLGGVPADSAHPEAAFDFLARMGHPSEAALSLVSDGTLGAGPIRTSQVEAGRPVWSGYRLPVEQTDRLILALRPLMARGVVNARYVLRLPDQKAKSAILQSGLRQVLSGSKTPAEGLESVRKGWEKLDDANPDLSKQLRRSLNL